MGRIYFNEDTGEFWEGNSKKRKPPEGFEYTGYTSLRFMRFFTECYYCPKCSKYHYVVTHYWYSRPQMLIEFGSQYGCSDAEQIVNFIISLGGRTRHYELVKKLKEKGVNLKEWESILRVKSRVRWKLLNDLLEGKDQDAIKAEIIAHLMTN